MTDAETLERWAEALLDYSGWPPTDPDPVEHPPVLSLPVEPIIRRLDRAAGRPAPG